MPIPSATLLLFLSLLFLPFLTLSSPVISPGVTLSIDTKIVEQAKTVYIDYLVELINNLTMPNYPITDKGYLNNNHLLINETSNNVNFTLDENNTYFGLQVNKL